MMDLGEELKTSITKKSARKGRRTKSPDLTYKAINMEQSSMDSTTSKAKEISIDITLDIQRSSSGTPPLRRMSGGWTEGKTSRKHFIEDERFQSSIKLPNTPPLDDIPIIPDIDDDTFLNVTVQLPVTSINRAVTLKELNTDLLSQNLFSGVQDVDLSKLTGCLYQQETLDEADEIWDLEKTFTEIIAEVYSDIQRAANQTVTVPKLGIRPDELTPSMQI